jgi:HEAT repeat protein
MITPMDGAITAMNLAGSMGTDPAIRAAPFALRILQDTNWHPGVRASAARVLGASRLNSDEVRSALLHQTTLQNPSQWPQLLRSSSGLALWCLDSQYASLGTRLALEAIVEIEKTAPRNPPQNFVRWLENRQLDPMQSLPTLKELMGSESPELRKAAADAVERIEAGDTQ